MIRVARRADLPEIVRLLADDPLGATRESLDMDKYLAAFEAIDADPNHELLVLELDGRIAGVLQLSFIPGLSRQGAWRAQIEGVRVARKYRSQGLGEAMLRHAIDRARERGCRLVQLTTDKTRADARRFYESLGFVASHEGMKFHL